MSYTNVTDSIIIQDFNESDELFEKRKDLTEKLLKLNQLNNVTATTLARLLINKMNLGVTYDVEIENILNVLKY
jgi:hypothetical protein